MVEAGAATRADGTEPLGTERSGDVTYEEARLFIEAGSVEVKLGAPWTGYWLSWATVLMGEGIVLYDLVGEDDGASLIDLTGDAEVGAGDGVPWGALIVAGEAGEVEERVQGVFNGEAAGETACESAATREHPIPTRGLVWTGTVIGAVDHGG